MPLPVSSLSRICRGIADFVGQELSASQNNVHVMIGNPADAEPLETDTDHRLNLFFYRLEPDGFGPSAAPDETWRLRLFCLVTAFGVLEDGVSGGENDLRLLGEVVRVFHETPILAPLDVNGESVRIRVVFQPMRVDELNHLWSTQGDVSYRPSVVYEMALVPVIPEEPALGGPLAGALGFEIRADQAGRRAPFGGPAAAPPVVSFEVDTGDEAWAPRICFVVDDTCHESLALEVGSAELAAFAPRVWIAGEPGAAVSLVFEIWDATEGWRTHDPPVAATASSFGIDSEAAAAATTVAVSLPFTDQAGQAVLYASRTYTRGSDGAELTVRSNPLLVTLFEVTP